MKPRKKKPQPISDKMNVKVISDIIGELLGEEAIGVGLFIRGRSKVSEFVVAKEMKMDIHLARAILYKLYENNLAIFERRKDKNKGWYITYWDFYPDNLEHIHKKIQMSKLEKLKERLAKEEGGEFYMCKIACTRMDFEKATEFNYRCPECGDIMFPLDNKRTIEFISERIEDIEKEMSS